MSAREFESEKGTGEAGEQRCADEDPDLPGGGKPRLKTVQGETLTAMIDGGKIMLKDQKGGMAAVTISNLFQSNGVIQVVDSALQPD